MVETRAISRAKALLAGTQVDSKIAQESVSNFEGDLECYSRTYRRRKLQSFSGTSEVVSSCSLVSFRWMFYDSICLPFRCFTKLCFLSNMLFTNFMSSFRFITEAMAIFYVAVLVEMSNEVIILIVLATLSVGLLGLNRRFNIQTSRVGTENVVESRETESGGESGSTDSKSDGNEVPSNEETYHLWCEFYDAMGDEEYDNLNNHIDR